MKKRMKGFWEDFKKFVSKGSILDLAIAVIIGAAFGKIITSLVNDILMPLISVVFAAVGLKGITDWKWEILDKAGSVTATLNYGNFISVIIDFFIIALCIFLIYRAIKKANGKIGEAAQKLKDRKNGTPAGVEAAPKEEPPKEPTTNELLIQIRDLLQAQNAGIDSEIKEADEQTSLDG